MEVTSRAKGRKISAFLKAMLRNNVKLFGDLCGKGKAKANPVDHVETKQKEN